MRNLTLIERTIVMVVIHQKQLLRDKILNDTKFLRYLRLFLSLKAIGNTYNYSKNQSYPLDMRLPYKSCF